jgi:hypothetical protein
MTPRRHRRASLKASRARRCNKFDLVDSRSVMCSCMCFAPPARPQQIFPPVTGCRAYGYPSDYSSGIAIGR